MSDAEVRVWIGLIDIGLVFLLVIVIKLCISFVKWLKKNNQKEIK